MTQDLGISNSEIQAFKRCRRKWWLAYVLCLGLRPEDAPLAGLAHLGTRVHFALEAKYGHGRDPLEVEKMLWEQGRPQVEARGDPELLATYDGDHEYAQLMLEGYLQWVEEEGVDEHYEVIGAEQEVRVPSGITGVDLRGKLDVRMRRRIDGRRLFVDHKTAGSLQTPTLEISEQFRMYALLERLLPRQEGEQHAHTDGGIVNILKRVKRTFRAKPPFYRRVEVRFNDHQLRSMWTRVHAVIRQILDARAALDAGADHQAVVYPTPAGDCNWSCPFFKVCPLMDDGSRWRDAIEANYVVIDPYARYAVRDTELVS